MSVPIRSLRLIGKNASFLDRSTGETGEIFLDLTSNTLRILNGKNTGGITMATRNWVNSTLQSGTLDISTTGKITASKFIGDVYASNGTSRILDNGTNGSNATFTGSVTGNVTGDLTGNVTGNVTGNLTGNADTVTNGVYTNNSYADPVWITSLAGTKITNAVLTTDSGTVTNTMLAGSIANNKLSNSSITIGTTSFALGASSTSLSGLTAVSSTSFTGALTGNASTATTLQTARNINGVSFNGSSDITVTASAATLTSTSLNSTVVSSSLTSVGTLTNLTVGGLVTVNNAITATGDITTDSNIVVDKTPTDRRHATNKKYVDSRAVALSIALS
jgi:hypothetical protein